MSGAAFRRSVQVFVDRNLSPAAQSAQLAAVAQAGRDELIASRRAPPAFDTFVDGREGASEAAVRPQGTIVYRFNVLGEAAVFAMGFLLARAPVRSGEFRKSFVYAVGAQGFGRRGRPAESFRAARIIRPEGFDPQRIGEAAEVMLFSRAPYARQVDVQFAGGRKLRFSVPPGMFDDAARAVRSRFATLDARRVYSVTFPGQYVLKGGRRPGATVQTPALVISSRG